MKTELVVELKSISLEFVPTVNHERNSLYDEYNSVNEPASFKPCLVQLLPPQRPPGILITMIVTYLKFRSTVYLWSRGTREHQAGVMKRRRALGP